MYAIRKVLLYIKHRLSATSIYGAHSPFLFELFNEVFNKPFLKEDRLAFETYRNSMLSNNHPILFEEHGAGSNQNRTMTIAEIAHKSSISLKKACLLINLTKFLKPVSILEFGTSTGVSAKALRIAASEAQITTVEGCNELASYINRQWNDPKTAIVSSTFDRFLASPLAAEKKWDLVYIDGNHTYEATLLYYKTIKEMHSHNNTCIVLDDIYWSKGMTSAWKKIISDDSNTLTLDLFFSGIVFFDHRLSKQNLRINL